jgi:hypothetical protein
MLAAEWMPDMMQADKSFVTVTSRMIRGWIFRCPSRQLEARQKYSGQAGQDLVQQRLPFATERTPADVPDDRQEPRAQIAAQ